MRIYVCKIIVLYFSNFFYINICRNIGTYVGLLFPTCPGKFDNVRICVSYFLIIDVKPGINFIIQKIAGDFAFCEWWFFDTVTFIGTYGLLQYGTSRHHFLIQVSKIKYYWHTILSFFLFTHQMRIWIISLFWINNVGTNIRSYIRSSDRISSIFKNIRKAYVEQL